MIAMTKLVITLENYNLVGSQQSQLQNLCKSGPNSIGKRFEKSSSLACCANVTKAANATAKAYVVMVKFAQFNYSNSAALE